MASCDENTAKALAAQAQNFNSILAANSTSVQTNDIIKKAQSYLVCDPECERKKQAQSLLTDYQNAQMNLFTGPESLHSTSQTYYTFTKDTNGYNEFNRGKLGDVADQITTKYSNAFNEIVHTSELLNSVYKSDFTNSKHAKELYESLVQKNKELDNVVKDTLNDISTSDRKSYYEDQELDNLRWWHKIYLALYILLLITFIISSFVVPSNMSINKRIGIAAFLGLYIYFVSDIAVGFVKMWQYILSFLPKNVYLSL